MRNLSSGGTCRQSYWDKGLIIVPGASGRVGEPGEAPEHDAGETEWHQDEFIPVLLGRTLTTELPTLLKAAMDNPEVTVAEVCGGSLVLAMAGLLYTRHLGLYLLEREVGPRIAHAVEELFAHERRGTVWRNEGPAPVHL